MFDPLKVPAEPSFDRLLKGLREARSIVISTHRHCDGDGLGAELAMAAALIRMGKTVRIVHVDAPAKKYSFLRANAKIEVFSASAEFPRADLALVFDTNDARLVEPLFSSLVQSCASVAFVDHHPRLEQGPAPTPESWINTSFASTGEMAYRLIHALGVTLDAAIARALYTSVVFDTQLFRYVKSDPRSHEMAAELLQYEKNPEDIHRALFATYTVEKMRFLAQALTDVSYFCDGRLAFASVDGQAAAAVGLEADETGDIIDQVMNIDSVEVAALVRQDVHGFKISLRSKGRVVVLPLAESLGGGGHPFAAGAYCDLGFEAIKLKLMTSLTQSLSLSGSASA